MPELDTTEQQLVLIRVDSNPVIGTGHLHRCMNLALELRSRGLLPHFVLGATDDASRSLLASAGFHWHDLGDHVHYLSDGGSRMSTSREEVLNDADHMSRLVVALGCDLVVLDHYSLDDYWVEKVKTHSRCRVLVIDDLHRNWSCIDFLVDMTLTPVPAATVPDHVVRCSGPSYAIIHPSYKSPRPQPRKVGEPPRILLFFGGVDAPNVTRSAISALSHLGTENPSIRVILGDANPHAEQLKASHSSDNVIWLTTAESMYPHLMCADLAVGAAGTATWERLCAGIPSVVVSIAENQIENGESLHAAGCHIYLGPVDSPIEDDIATAVRELLASEEMQSRLSIAGKTLVDGFGSARVCELLYPTPVDELALRSANIDDCMTLFRWTNDAETRRASKTQRLVPWEEHQEWFKRVLESEDELLYVGELAGMSVAQIRFSKFDDALLLSYSVDPTQRGRGLGHRIVAAGLRAIPDRVARTVHAEVKSYNLASLSVFRAAGFDELPIDGDGMIRFTYKMATK